MLKADTTTLTWRTSSASDAVMLAGVLRSNDKLTTLNMGAGGELNESDREEIGRALLDNRKGRVGYCDIYGLRVGLNKASFDLRDREQVRSLRSFVLLCGLRHMWRAPAARWGRSDTGGAPTRLRRRGTDYTD